MKQSTSVLIVGAGPGGCSAAYFLKKFDEDNNLNVDLVEKNARIRYSQYHDMCGEAVHSKILKDFSEIKLKGIVKDIQTIEEYYPGDIKITTKLEGLLVDRPILFNSIINEFEKLDGHYFNATIKNFQQERSSIDIKFDNKRKKYDYVIAADGANSLFRKKLGISGRTKTLLQYILDDTSNNNSLQFYYDERYKGDYRWDFPHDDLKKIGFPLEKGNIKKPNGKIIKKQARMVGFGGIDRYVINNILLVGDAACQTNPLTKGGIRVAIAAGKMAAHALISGEPKLYDERWKKSNFSSNLFLDAFNQLKEMNNDELTHHISPFKDLTDNNYFSKIKLNTKLLLHYRKYLDIYRAYELSNEFGW